MTQKLQLLRVTSWRADKASNRVLIVATVRSVAPLDTFTSQICSVAVALLLAGGSRAVTTSTKDQKARQTLLSSRL